MDKSKRHLLIAIPTMGSIHPQLVGRLLQWSKTFNNHELSFYFSENVSPHDRARNQLVRYFLSDDRFSHILMIDSDTIPPIDAPTRLLSHNLDFVSALTPIQSWRDGRREVYDNCYERVETLADGSPKTHIALRDTGLKQIYRCGASCLMLSRNVFSKLTSPYFEFHYDEDLLEVRKSEDITFCDKVRAAGFDLYADTGVKCIHEKKTYL